MTSSKRLVLPNAWDAWVTVVFASHNKPIHCRETIDSLVKQTFPRWKCVIYDSGILYDQGYFKGLDSRVHAFRSEETEDMQKQFNMASWLFNRHKFDTEWAMFLCDDDLLYEDAIKGFYEYASSHPDTEAMYGHAHFSGPGQPFAYSRANFLRGRCVNGMKLDCKIDGGQVCVKSKLMEKYKWREDKEAQGHADGLWLEEIGNEVPFEPVNVMVLHNRNIPGLSLGVKNL